MMLKLLPADDEAFIRDKLKTAIDWSEYDIEIVGVARDGAEALELRAP